MQNEFERAARELKCDNRCELSAFAQKVTCQHYSTASEATGWHTPRTNHQNLGVMSTVPSGPFARGTVLIARQTLTKIRVFVQSRDIVRARSLRFLVRLSC